MLIKNLVITLIILFQFTFALQAKANEFAQLNTVLDFMAEHHSASDMQKISKAGLKRIEQMIKREERNPRTLTESLSFLDRRLEKVYQKNVKETTRLLKSEKQLDHLVKKLKRVNPEVTKENVVAGLSSQIDRVEFEKTKDNISTALKKAGSLAQLMKQTFKSSGSYQKSDLGDAGSMWFFYALYFGGAIGLIIGGIMLAVVGGPIAFIAGTMLIALGGGALFFFALL